MKYIISLLFLCCLAITANAQLVNDPNAEVRQAKNFHGINVSSAFDVYLDQSAEEAVAVSASEPKYRERIKVEVKDGILYIRYDSDGKWGSGKKSLKVYISFKQINQLDISGSCDVYLSGVLKADELKVALSGASDFKGQLDVKKLKIDLSGASDMTVTGGRASDLDIEASGASEFKGLDLSTDYCNARAQGASDIKITVNKELSAHASGASDVQYRGEGTVKDIKTSGASNVNKMRS
jgi:hypothetical protein